MRVCRSYPLLLLVALLTTTSAVGDECLAIDGPAVRAADLRGLIAHPGAGGEDRILARTPNPGTRRWVSHAELLRWGLEPNPDLPRDGICLQRSLQRLAPGGVLEAIQAAVAERYSAAKSVELTSFQPEFSPAGRIHMPKSGYRLLSTSGDSCRFQWHGTLEYDSHRSLPVRVLGIFHLTRVVLIARRDLKPGDSLSAEDFERLTENGCAAQSAVATDLPEGSILKQSVRRGEILRPTMLLPPPVVRQGEIVRIAGRVGEALVSVDAVAEKNGRLGESIFVHNQDTGKRIWVMLTGPGEGLTAQRWR